MNRNLGSKYRVEISAYATTGVFSPPTTLENVLTLIREYPDMVKKVNNGKGAPVRVDIESLSSLDSKFAAYARLGGMDSVYNEAINKLDDMKMADKEFRDWEKTKLWNDEQQAQIDEYFTRLRTAFNSMKHAISSMDTKNGVKRDHFDQAFKDYGYGPENIPNRYMREFTNLTHHVREGFLPLSSSYSPPPLSSSYSPPPLSSSYSPPPPSSSYSPPPLSSSLQSSFFFSTVECVLSSIA
ncbi:hypothetical protein AVEN_237190-1 [Araneus ventricosus]|uniref:Uncharacterized protein n=1 Tax=Araneus ventricosus TaxID=182803 RepID=A0A4Y2HYP5_ARAVE|nr:hypothetical protein AVEN_237190-1 [Araneus ventricosus]